jgi:hypothetical protein
MIRSLLVTLFFTFTAGAAQAQFRTITPDAKRGVLSHVQDMAVEIDGKRMQLAPGAQIRDGNNMAIVPVAIPAGVTVKYLRDDLGQLMRVWILSPREAAEPDRKK